MANTAAEHAGTQRTGTENAAAGTTATVSGTTGSRPSRARVQSPTEQRNPATAEIDTASTAQILEMIHAEDAAVIPAVRAVLPELARLVDAATEAVEKGGMVHYFGAGTSGRLGVLDAAEIPPTYGVEGVMTAHLAGGTGAFLAAAENVEDNLDSGAADATGLAAVDVAIGLAASGRTPYVAGALEHARAVGATTALITSHPDPELAPLADIVIAADTGPEAITGSTRMKAGTAEKLILNGFSTALMVKLGRTYSNLMITMQPTNAKLRGRAITMLTQATGEDDARCANTLDQAGDLPTALVLLLTDGATDEHAVERAHAALTAARGRVRDAVQAFAQ